MREDDRVRMHLDVDPRVSYGAAREVDERSFRILILGDLAGAGRVALRADPIEIDRDNVDDVLAAVRPAVRFRLGAVDGPEINASFRSLEDFHPDRLLQTVPLLRSLVEMRDDARSGRLPGAQRSAGASGAAPAAPARPVATGGSLLDQILDDTAGPAPAPAARAPEPSDLHAFIRSAVEPHRVHEIDPEHESAAAAVEDTMAAVLRAVLHHPEFQALEAAWRGIDLLVRRLETDARLKVYVLDFPREALAEDGAGAGSVLHHVLDRGGWSVVAGLYTFGGSADDAQLLGSIGRLCRHYGAAFIAAAAPRLAGVASFATEPDPAELSFANDAAWQELRAQPEAAHIALALPRFLVRVPYDPREAPCEDITLEEMSAPPRHEDYLWGNPALLAALVLGEAFTEAGRPVRPDGAPVISGMALHIYREGFEAVAKPVAETLLTDRMALRLIDEGLVPVLSEKNGDAVRVAGLRSLAEPAAPLAVR